MISLNVRIFFYFNSQSLPNLKFHFPCFQSTCLLKIFFVTGNSISTSLVSLLNLFFKINPKLNFQIFPGFGATENLHHVWCLFLHAFRISSRVRLHKRCGDAPCVPSQLHKVKFVSVLRFCYHYSY